MKAEQSNKSFENSWPSFKNICEKFTCQNRQCSFFEKNFCKKQAPFSEEFAVF